MGNYNYTALQITSACGKPRMDRVAAKATELGLQHTGVITLPVNRNYYMVVYPSGSKALWPEDEAHLKALAQLNLFIEESNLEEGARYICALQTRIMDTGEGIPAGSIVYETPEVEEE